jgi:TolB-like protein
MPQKPNKLTRFWQELKRRRVIHVVAVYASATFVIIDLVGNLAEPLNLPASLPTIVVIVLAIGFPLAIILSWLYDLTAEGVEKTKPMSEIKEGEKSTVPNAWKIATYVSFMVILGLIVLNVMGTGNRIRPGDIQRVLILPFANYTGDEELEWFVSGMHASMIQEMGQISGFQVINRTSSNVYKNVDRPVHEIAKEVNADAVIETDVMCLGDTICTQHRLISALPEEEQLWIGDYKEEKSQILNLYNKFIRNIADEVKIELTADEEKSLTRARKVDREAYDAYLRSHQYWGDFSEASLQKALEYLNDAVEEDPEWAPLYAGLAKVWVGLRQFGFVPPDIAGPKIDENIAKSMELDPALPDLHFALSFKAWRDYDWEKAEKAFLKTLAMNPSDAMPRIYYAHLLTILRRPNEALVQGQLAVDLDPLNPLILALYAVVMDFNGEHQSAIGYAEKALSIDPGNAFARTALQTGYHHLGDFDKSWAIWIEQLILWLGNEVVAPIDTVYQEHGLLAATEALIEVYEDSKIRVVYPYFEVGDFETGLDNYEIAYEMNEPIEYISLDFKTYPQLKENPRYIALLNKMNLPLPEE